MSVLIFSIENDLSSSDVMDWISAIGGECIRINNISLTDFKIQISNTHKTGLISIGAKNLNEENVSAVWYRKWAPVSLVQLPPSHNEQLSERVNIHLREEFRHVSVGFYSKFNKLKALATSEGDVNKLLVLELALKYGMTIPETIVTNKKTCLLEFWKDHKEIICKPASNGILVVIDQTCWAMYASKLSDDMARDLPDTFFPSLIQEYINKRYEIRTFYLDGKCYSMAIFSQNDAQTSVDFRRYNSQYPNRAVPYQLPRELEMKIAGFMKALGLNTGSLDFIRSHDGQYVFLEVNPYGQFGMISFPCNYFLEKYIANWLVN